jgi:hypothetical protein
LIRSRLFEGSIGEDDRQLALHNALVVAKIIRIDFPRAWPDALTSLVTLLRSLKDGNQTYLSGALLILLRIVKEMGTARLKASQTALQSVTPELVYLLGEIYTASTVAWTTFLTTGRGDEDDADVAMQNSLGAFKALRRLLIVGYEYPHREQAVKDAWTISQTQFGQFLGYVSPGSPIPAPYLDVVGKHLLQFTKLHIEMSDVHPASFASLPNSFSLVRSYWELVVKFAQVYEKSGGLRENATEMDDAEAKTGIEGPLLEKLALKGLLLIRLCIRMVNQPQQTFKYRSAEVKDEQAQLLEQVKKDLLTDEVIVQMANVIISNLLVFRKADLDAWEENPEDWEQQEEAEGNAWEWQVRPCAENVLQHLLTSYKHLLLQPLLSYFESVKAPEASIMTKEAVYTTLGIAAPHVYEQVDFDGLLRSTIVNDAQREGELANVLRRRIAILISLWIPVKIAKESRTLVYEIYRHFMNPNDQTNDIVVRITAARQFKAVTSDFEFEGEAFAPYAESILTELLRLLPQLEVDETQLAILDTTKQVIERMDTHVVPFADLIMGSLPQIWASAGDLGFMMKQAVLTILQSLVMSMKADSQRFYPLIQPLVAEAVQEGSDIFLYLIEEALELWLNMLLYCSPPVSQEVLSLVGPALRLLSEVTEHQLQLLSITSNYVVLSPETLLEDRYRQVVLKALSETFNSKRREYSLLATKNSENLLRYAEELGGVGGLKVVVKDMWQSGFLTKIFEGIHDAYEAHQTSGPNRRQPQVESLILTDYFTILSRIALADPTTFVESLEPLGPLDRVWAWLSSEWFSSFDSTADDGRQKLCLLAMTRLLELPHPIQELVLTKLQDYFSMWTSVISRLLDDQTPPRDMMVMTEEIGQMEYDTAVDVRERALLTSDPIRRVDAFVFVKERLAGLVERVGGEQAFQEHYAANVDKDVLAGYNQLGMPRNG